MYVEKEMAARKREQEEGVREGEGKGGIPTLSSMASAPSASFGLQGQNCRCCPRPLSARCSPSRSGAAHLRHPTFCLPGTAGSSDRM